MFQFRRFPAYAYLIQRTLMEYCSIGFPHSVISGSKPICGSPKLIAACHDLHRLLMPRHSPCALISLTSSGQAPYPSLPASPKARSFRCPSSSSRTRFAGLRSDSEGQGQGRQGWCCSVVRTLFGSLNKNHAGFRDFWLIVFTHYSKQFSLSRLKFPQFLLLLCCLLFHLELSFTLFSFQGAPSNLC